MTAGNDTVAIRAPAGKVALGLIERTGQPIAAPSANRANRISPTRAEHVLADLDGRIDLIIDSGPTALGLESTVLDLTTPRAAAAPAGTDLDRGTRGSARRAASSSTSPPTPAIGFRAPDRCRSTTHPQLRRSASTRLEK